MAQRLLLTAFIILSFLTAAVNADEVNLSPFASGSYQQLLSSHRDKPFMLVVWSITCSSCLKDMALLNKMHKAHPKLDIVMLATDDPSEISQVADIIVKNDLGVLENWQFSDENPQKLRYEIDPKWYGELPRTYFFNAKHERAGVSGVLSEADYATAVKKILN